MYKKYYRKKPILSKLMEKLYILYKLTKKYKYMYTHIRTPLLTNYLVFNLLYTIGCLLFTFKKIVQIVQNGLNLYC